MDPTRVFARQSPSIVSDGSSNALVSLISNPFNSEIQTTSFYASLAWTFGGSFALAFAFCIFRPRTSAVYAPRAKHADAKHAPPPLGPGLFNWIKPVWDVKEPELVDKIGLDAVVFLRFLRMCRNIFLVLTVLGLCIILPINMTGEHDAGSAYGDQTLFTKFTPQFSFGQRFWGYTALAYIFDIVICGFLWSNYRAVVRLRRAYFNSPEYRMSLHSRTLMLTHMPQASRTDDGIIRLVEEAKSTESVPNTAVARNVKDLPDLIEDHEEAVKRLEKILAKYLKDPANLPVKRPTCKPSRKDRAHVGSHGIDAIEYWTGRIRELELEVKEIRVSVDKRNPMPYGFASYTHIEDAHAVAKAARKKSPHGTVIQLAPKPHDIIWKNLPMSKKARRSRSLWNSLWMTILTVLFIVPNVLVAVFLSDFANLGAFWPAFQQNLEANKTGYGILQGILAPLINSLFYLILPTIFRRMYNNSGDTSKTSRERHVTSRLFVFYIFNQLIVLSIFASVWRFVANIIQASHSDQNLWDTVKQYHVFSQFVSGLCNTTAYWLTSQLQHNLGAAVDLAQLWSLTWGTMVRKFGHPTPRQVIELSAPQPFDYASYYNNYLFTVAVGLCFATLNPLILPVTAFYIAIDAWLKKYMLLYICITKTESGGAFWRMLVNRILFAAVLGNLVIALVIGAQGIVLYDAATTTAAAMLYAMAPIPFLLWAFKWYCTRMFDNKFGYVTTQSYGEGNIEDAMSGVSTDGKSHKPRVDRVGVRFGNPALYKKLMTPMVSAKSQHLLKSIYTGRMDADDMAGGGVSGYSDVYMSQMAHDQPGKMVVGPAPFELVSEGEMDFEHFKKHAEFRDEFGGDGELYGRPEDISRPGSRATMSSMGLMGPGQHRREISDSPSISRTRYDYAAQHGEGVTYPKGYHSTPAAGFRSDSTYNGYGGRRSGDVLGQGHPAFRDTESIRSARGLVGHAAGMGRSGPDAGWIDTTPGEYSEYRSYSPNRMGRAETPGSVSGGEETSYDYFRRGRR